MSAASDVLSSSTEVPVTARQRRVLDLTESHERRLEALRDKMRAIEEADKQHPAGNEGSAYLQLQRKLFQAKFELNASRRSKEELDKEGEKQRAKNHDNMATLHAELKRTHEAMH